MKIALVHRKYTTHGGTERYLVGFSRYLVREGHEVTVLCNEIREDLKEEPGITFVHLPMLRPGRAIKVLSLMYSVQQALKNHRFDRVMGFGRHSGHQLFRAGGGSHAAFLRRCHPYRRWFSLHDLVESWADARALTSAQIVIANSKLCANDIREDHPGLRVEVVYNGVDSQRFRPDLQVRRQIRESLGLSGKVAIFLGTGFRRKGLDIAIESLPLDWSLLVVGTGKPWKSGPNVRWLGPAQEPERFLQAADAMILPTRYDPCANACLEAMACGIPALSTPTNGASELFPEPWLCCTTPAQFREAFSRLSPELGERCRKIAEAMAPEASFSKALALLVEAGGQ
jgi:UDP-glucose:(heptosyl)LPS alpha-1,3-glucosyltransferase